MKRKFGVLMVTTRNLALAVSALSLVAYIAAMSVTFGQRHWAASAPPTTYQMPERATLEIYDSTIPVYQIDQSQGVRLVGRGHDTGGRQLKIEIYPDLEDAGLAGNAMIWMPGNFRSIRALMPSSMPAELRSIMRQFTDGLEENLHRLTQTSRFQEVYRPELETIVAEAINTSWKAPATRTALSDASTAIGQEISTKFIEDAMPVLLEYQQAAFAEIVDAGKRDFIGRLLNWRDTLAPLRATLGQTFRDPRVQSALAAELEAVMTIPETIEFARVFGITVARRLAKDPRWPQLIDRVLNDDALALQIDAIEALAAGAGKQVLSRLVSRKADKETNVLALEIMRDVLLDRSRSFLLLIPEQRQDIIDRADGENWFLLNRTQGQ
jgi:hypothetical protein